MSKQTKFSTALMVSAFMMPVAANHATAQSPEADLAAIMEMWPGTYNNNNQIDEAIANGDDVWRLDGSGEGGYLNITSHYARVDLPAFGENVLYVEEYRDGVPDATYRQRIYTLWVDEEEQVVRVRFWNFKDRQKYVGAWQELSRIAELSPDELSALPGICDLRAERKGENYYLPMRGKDCAFGEQYFNYQVILRPDAFWYRDKIVKLEGDTVSMTAADFAYHTLDKISE